MKQVHNSVGLSIFESMLFQEFKGFPHCSLSGCDDSKQNSVVPFQGVWTLITFLINSLACLLWLCVCVCVLMHKLSTRKTCILCVFVCFSWRVICRHTGTATPRQTHILYCSHKQTHTYCTRPDATWPVPGDLQDTLILKLLMAIINHILLNHFRDREGVGEREGN